MFDRAHLIRQACTQLDNLVRLVATKPGKALSNEDWKELCNLESSVGAALHLLNIPIPALPKPPGGMKEFGQLHVPYLRLGDFARSKTWIEVFWTNDWLQGMKTLRNMLTLSLGTDDGSEGDRQQPAAPDQKEAEEPTGELPTKKVPGVISLNVLRTTLEMLGSPGSHKRLVLLR